MSTTLILTDSQFLSNRSPRIPGALSTWFLLFSLTCLECLQQHPGVEETVYANLSQYHNDIKKLKLVKANTHILLILHPPLHLPQFRAQELLRSPASAP